MRDSRGRTLSLIEDLSDAQWQVPYRPGFNPIAWELAHLAWFGEFWILRGPHRVGEDGLIHAERPTSIDAPDSLFDSARLAHHKRWQSPLPSRTHVLAMLAEQLETCLHALPASDADADLYFHRLTLFHEDMHGEALIWLRAALGYVAPSQLRLLPQPMADRIQLSGGEIFHGWPVGLHGFAFDNELPGTREHLQPFEIDTQVVTAGQFLQFVVAGGYEDPALWPAEASAWLNATQPHPPSRWRRNDAGNWQLRWFDRWTPLDPNLPALHVNAFEAQAYCAWAGRRLPRAAEWELAASSAAGHGFRWGNSVWEWTADAFIPHEGFVPGPYTDYSQPWFGTHRELRGGSFATHARMHDVSYRNFFTPERTDIFAGFRTVSRH